MAFIRQLRFLWRFRLRVVPLALSLGTSYSVSASCVTRKKNFSRAFFPRGLLRVTINGLSERGDTPSLISSLHFVKQKRSVGRRHLEFTVLAFFYESVNRLETKEIKKNKQHSDKNKLDKRIKTTKPSKDVEFARLVDKSQKIRHI